MIGTVQNLSHVDLAAAVHRLGGCDSVVCDPPYSARTHSKQRHGRRPEKGGSDDGWVSARGLDYASWSDADVAAFVDAWSPICRGWVVVMTDSELYPAWRDALRASGRYVFAPIPVVQVGMNVRLAGDGPSSWTCWLVVARPRSGLCVKWGTLPGAYVGNPFDAGENTATASRKRLVVGGKPRWLMEAIVGDYTRPGDLVVDPTCGAGTTLLAAKLLGRRFVGGDISSEHAAIARERLADLPTAPKKGTLALDWGT